MDDHRPAADVITGGLRPPAPRTLLGLQIAAVAILVGWALHATASVSALIAATLFTAIVVAPLDRWVGERTGRGWIGHAAAFLTMVVVFLVFLAGLLFAAQRVAAEFLSLSQLPTGSIPVIGDGAPAAGDGASVTEGAGGAAADGRPEAGGAQGGGIDGLLGGAGGEVASRLASLASTVALTTLQYATATLAGVALLVFLALIMLIDAPRWRTRLARAFGEPRAREAGDVMAVLSHQLVRYVLVRAAIGLATAVLYMLWLWPFGVGLLFVWGVLTFLLSFIPNLGSIISGVLPTIYAFLTKDFGTAIAVGAGLTAIEQVMGNDVDPRVQGHQVSVSPIVIFAGLLIFAWIWGVPGALLSTPVLIAAVIVFSRVDALRPVALLLSNCQGYDELDKVVGH